MSAEPWFAVGDEDVFPETFLNYLPFSVEQRDAFLALHSELLHGPFWRQVQGRIQWGVSRGDALCEARP